MSSEKIPLSSGTHLGDQVAFENESSQTGMPFQENIPLEKSTKKRKIEVSDDESEEQSIELIDDDSKNEQHPPDSKKKHIEIFEKRNLYGQFTPRSKWVDLKKQTRESDLDNNCTEEPPVAFKTECCYCGFNSIQDDRLNSSNERMVPCCNRCYWSKLNTPLEDYIKACTNMIAYFSRDSTLLINYDFIKPLENGTTYFQYRSRAHKGNIEFQIDQHLFNQLVGNPCTYCGIYIPGHSIGIDRTDSYIGYFPSNIVSCCSRCSRIKGNQPFGRCVNRLSRIAHRFRSKTVREIYSIITEKNYESIEINNNTNQKYRTIDLSSSP